MGHNGPGEIKYIGIYNGGCNGPYDLYVDENAWCYKRFTNDTATKSAIIFADSVKDILKFLEEFERFEQAFYGWIDSFDAE